MAEKKSEKKEERKTEKKKIGEELGISGFTLGIVSLALVIFNFVAGILVATVGIIFCLVQQKKNPTKKGKKGLIINIIGFIANAFFWVYYIKYILPMIQEVTQNFPV